MKTTPADPWVSYYLYYKTDPDNLLSTMVWPLVQQLREKQLIRQFFFIRYDDNRGPHIRLRLLPSRTQTRQTVMRQTKRIFPDAVFAAYVPEIERYGGPAGLPIAERLFEASSHAVLQLVTLHKTPHERSWNYQRALASAIQMHIGMLQCFGLNKAETTAICAHIAVTESGGKAVEQFEQGFVSQREAIVPQLTALWAACQKNLDFTDSWFAEWRQAMAKIGTEIHRADTTHKLELVHSSQHDSQLWYVYESYIHMTNNRLGIVRQDEAFVAYLLQRSLEQGTL